MDTATIERLQALYDEARAKHRKCFNNLFGDVTLMQQLQFEAVKALPELLRIAREAAARSSPPPANYEGSGVMRHYRDDLPGTDDSSVMSSGEW